MKVTEPKGRGGPKGHGRVNIISDTRVGVTLTDADGKVSNYQIEYPQGVELVRIDNWKLQEVEDVFIQLTPDKDDIQYIRPLNGTFMSVFVGFGAEEGKLPTIRWQDKRDYKGDPWLPERYQFFPLLEVVASPPYTGMRILAGMTYEFDWDENLEEIAIVGNTKKRHDHFMAFLRVYGFDLENDNFADVGTFTETNAKESAELPNEVINILPELEEILFSRSRLGQVTVENGWVREDEGTIAPAPVGLTRAALEAAVAEQG